jgi:hypothetical protein
MAVSFKVVKYSPQLEDACHRRQRLGWISFGSTPKLATKPGSEKGNPLCPPCIGHHFMRKGGADFSSFWLSFIC